MPTGRMVRLVTVGGQFEAKVLAARLGAEGVLWQLQGGDGPYPMGPVHVLVDESDLDLARAIIEVVGAEDRAYEAEQGSTKAPMALWLVVLGLVLLAVVSMGRVMVAASGPGPARLPVATTSSGG